MNDSLELVEKLAAQARLEAAPLVDVADRVIPRLRQETSSPVWPMALFASGTAAAAVLTLVICMPLIDLLTDPWSLYFASSVGVLP